MLIVHYFSHCTSNGITYKVSSPFHGCQIGGLFTPCCFTGLNGHLQPTRFSMSCNTLNRWIGLTNVSTYPAPPWSFARFVFLCNNSWLSFCMCYRLVLRQIRCHPNERMWLVLVIKPVGCFYLGGKCHCTSCISSKVCQHWCTRNCPMRVVFDMIMLLAFMWCQP